MQRALLAHRDVAGQVLRGDETLEGERKSRQGDVDRRVASLAGALVIVASDRAIDESSALREDWAVLARQVQGRTIGATESDFGHRLLTEQTLQVIDFVAHASGLGRDRDPSAALLASVTTRSLPRLAIEIAALSLPGAADARLGDDRQLAATESALARTLGRLNERIEAAPTAMPALAAATADAGAAARNRYFMLLRDEDASRSSTAAAGVAAVAAVQQLTDTTQAALSEMLVRRVDATRAARDLLLAAMGALALAALALVQRLVTAGATGRRQSAIDGNGVGDAAAHRRPADATGLVARREPSSGEEAGRLLRRLREAPDGGVARQAGSTEETLPPG